MFKALWWQLAVPDTDSRDPRNLQVVKKCKCQLFRCQDPTSDKGVFLSEGCKLIQFSTKRLHLHHIGHTFPLKEGVLKTCCNSYRLKQGNAQVTFHQSSLFLCLFRVEKLISLRCRWSRDQKVIASLMEGLSATASGSPRRSENEARTQHTQLVANWSSALTKASTLSWLRVFWQVALVLLSSQSVARALKISWKHEKTY